MAATNSLPAPGESGRLAAVSRSQLAALGVALLAATVGVVLVVRSSVACAAPLPLVAERTGKATYYGPAGSGGACSFPSPPANHLTTAVGPSDFAGGAACGGYLQVTGRKGTITVKVDNLCPECAPGHLDLSTEAFTKLDDPGVGVTPITFHQVVDPAVPAGLSFRVKEGSSQWWLGLLVDNHGNPLRSVEVSSTGGESWKALTRTSYNYWLAESGAGNGPFSVRVTDVRGHRVTAGGIALKPGVVQTTTVSIYRGTTVTNPTRATTPSTSTTRTTTSASSSPPSDSVSASSSPGDPTSAALPVIVPEGPTPVECG